MRLLTALREAFPTASVLHPGHGASGKPDLLIAQQREYIAFYREQVAAQLKDGQWNGSSLSESARKAVAAAVEAKFPGHLPVAAIPNLIELNADAIARELSAEAK